MKRNKLSELLNFIKAREPVSSKDICEALGISRQWAYELIKRARSLGYPIAESGGVKCKHKKYFFSNPESVKMPNHSLTRFIGFRLMEFEYKLFKSCCGEGKVSQTLRELVREYIAKKRSRSEAGCN